MATPIAITTIHSPVANVLSHSVLLLRTGEEAEEPVPAATEEPGHGFSSLTAIRTVLQAPSLPSFALSQ